MEYVKLGNTGLDVSLFFVLGAWVLGMLLIRYTTWVLDEEKSRYLLLKSS